jgi:hypothetical protein
LSFEEDVVKFGYFCVGEFWGSCEVLAVMASYRRSASFQLLTIDSPGDGDVDVRTSEASKDIIGKSKKKRRMRRSKSRKALSDSHIDHALVDDENLAVVEESDLDLAAATPSARISIPLTESAVQDLIQGGGQGLADLHMDSVPLSVESVSTDPSSPAAPVASENEMSEKRMQLDHVGVSKKEVQAAAAGNLLLNNSPASAQFEQTLQEDLSPRSAPSTEMVKSSASVPLSSVSIVFPVRRSGGIPTSSLSVSSHASSTEPEKDSVSSSEAFGGEEAGQGFSAVVPRGNNEAQSDSPRDRLLREQMQTDKGEQGSEGIPGIPVGSIVASTTTAGSTVSSNSLLVWPLPLKQLEPNTTTNGSIRDPVYAAQRSPRPIAELRQRSVLDKNSDINNVQENGMEGGARGSLSKVMSFKKHQMETDPSYLGCVDAVETPGYRTPPQVRQPLSSFETPHLTDWDRLMAANSDYPKRVDLSPMRYLQGEIQRGSAVEHHSSVNMEQKRDRVYNTMFHVLWRCELLIDVGFFVCLDSFLSLCTVMPARILMFLWQHLVHWSFRDHMQLSYLISAP